MDPPDTCGCSADYAGRVLTVGLTGGIGSGKSTVADLLAGLGAVVIDADQVAREVVEPGTPTLAAIAARFGEHLIRADGSLDRAGLAAVAFPDPGALADLNAITGPAISARVALLRAGIDPATITVYDMPLLVERHLWPHEHLTLVVGADEPVRLGRLVGQRGLSEEDARHRMSAQASDAERHAAADVWIDNNGAREATLRQVRRLWETRLAPFNANLVTGTRSRRPDQATVVEPDPTWPAQAARLVARIEDALGALPPGAVLSVDHIGSTSVPDLIAKDVIDLQVTVRHLADADDPSFVEALEQRGFLRVPENVQDHAHPPRTDAADWQKRFHASTDPGRVAHLHVRELGSGGWEFALLFRDWLRAEGDERAAYAAAKRRLLGVVESTTAYAAAKEPWFAAAYPRALAWAQQSGWRAPGGAHQGGWPG